MPKNSYEFFEHKAGRNETHLENRLTHQRFVYRLRGVASQFRFFRMLNLCQNSTSDKAKAYRYALRIKDMKSFIVDVKSRNAVSEAVRTLKKGGIIVYPTETCYGIGADATNEKAVKKVIGAKEREAKPISVIVSGLPMIRKYCFLNKDAVRLVKKLMPAALTLVVRKRRLPELLSRNTVGFRIPASEFAFRLVKRYGRPITATSANISGESQIYKIKEAERIFSGKVDMIINAGNLPRRAASTVFDIKSKRILRKGGIARKRIMEAMK